MQKINNSKLVESPRVLLVNPPCYRLFKSTYSYNVYTLSLGYLANEIREKTKWLVTVYNADFVIPSEKMQVSYLSGEGFSRFRSSLQDQTQPIWREIRTVIKESKPAVVGIHCNAGNSKTAAIIASMAKALDKQTIIIIGGPHPTSIGKDAMRDPNIDVVVKGEGEQTIVELLNRIEDGKHFDNVDGIIFRTDETITETANRKPMSNLDSLSFPSKFAKEVLRDYEKYPKSAFDKLIATRGCPHNCFFCGSRGVFGRKTRFRSVENVIDEIHNLQRIELNSFEFLDDTFGVNKTYLKALCNSLIENCPRIRWRCTTRADLLDEEIAELMKRAGCYQIEIGLESGSTRILNEMRKGITVEQAISAARIVKKHGIIVRVNFIFGFPTETEQTLNDTINAMARIDGRFGYSVFTPYPGSEAYDFCEKNGLLGSNYDASLYLHQSPENCFCANISKERFRAVMSEIEKYVDRREKLEDVKQFLFHGAIDKLVYSGNFRNTKFFSTSAKNAILELKLFLKELFSTKLHL